MQMRIRCLGILFSVVAVAFVATADPCPDCHASGKIHCPSCGGSGVAGNIRVGPYSVASGCTACGGRAYGGDKNWGAPGSGLVICPTCNGTGEIPAMKDSVAQPDDTAARNATEAARKKKVVEERLRTEAEARAKQEKFERDRQAALKSMKGIAEKELGLQGLGDTKPDTNFGLKDLDENLFQKPDRANPFDTRVRGPLALDLPGGKDIHNPAFSNPKFKNGYDALHRNDLAAALKSFELAQQDRPNDKSVRDALQMVRSMLRWPKDRENAEQRLRERSGTYDLKAFLFPGHYLFPENPDKPLLNPLLEKQHATSLPNRGETAADFTARFVNTDLYRQLEKMYGEQMTPWNNRPSYPRGQYPAVDKVLDATLQRMAQNWQDGIQAACRKAADEMKEEHARLESSGLIKPGEDLAKREASHDPSYSDAMMPIRHRLYEQLGRDIADVMLRDEIALDRLKSALPELQRNASDLKYLFPDRPDGRTDLQYLFPPHDQSDLLLLFPPNKPSDGRSTP